MNETITYSVPDMSTGHCRAAITAEVGALTGVEAVYADLDTKLVRVAGQRSTTSRSGKRSAQPATRLPIRHVSERG